MSTITKTKCDSCEKEVEDVYAHKGWIIVRGGTNLTVTAGRKNGNKGEAKTKLYLDCRQDLHFCCTDCLVDKLGTSNAD